MKITGTGQLQNKSVKKTKSKGADTSGSFAAELASESPAAGAAGGVAGSAPLTSVNALLSVQEVPDSTQGRSKGLHRAEEMLGLLEEVRKGLLLGAIPVSRLKVLATLARGQRAAASDPKLIEILEEIELRSEVELAKLGY